MKILVAVKRVIDHNIQVRVKPDGSGVDLDHVKMSMNPFDEIALEEAVLQKEKGKVSEILAVSIGDQKTSETLRTALALGADRALHIQTDKTLESLSIAKILHQITLDEKVDMVFLGKQSIDSDANQTAQMLAALLHWGQATFASKLDLYEDHAIICREVDHGVETLNVKIPFVMSADLRLNEPRYASLPNIMKAKRKTIEEKNLENFSIDVRQRLNILKVEEPNLKKETVFFDNPVALIQKLKEQDLL